MRRLIAGVTLSVVLAGCYEMPPQLSTYPSVAADWPTVQAYGYDSFDARNRWFQRAFLVVPSSEYRLVTASDATLPVCTTWSSSGTAEPVPPAGPYTDVDWVEMIALLEETEKEAAPVDLRTTVAAVLFHCDLVALVLAWASDMQTSELQQQARVAALTRARRTALDAEMLSSLSSVPPPPPLRGNEWTEAALDLPSGLLAHARDSRWTRVYRRRPTPTASEDALLVRSRVGITQAGGLELLPLPSETWLLEGNEARVFRFDRQRWLHGVDPWREMETTEEFSIRDPLGERVGWRTGTTSALCGSCHSDGAAAIFVPRLSSAVESQRKTLRTLWEKGSQANR